MNDKGTDFFFDQLVEDWRTEWRNRDFSWHALAEADWSMGAQSIENPKCWRAPLDFPGNGKLVGSGDDAYIQASVQDYWRWSWGLDAVGDVKGLSEHPILLTDQDLIDAGLLVEWDQKLWHILHLPDTDLSKRHDPAADLLAELLTQRLLMSRACTGGADLRVQLIGARARNLHKVWEDFDRLGTTPDERTLHIRSIQTEFGACQSQFVNFGPGTQLEHSLFSGEANFSGCNFGERTRLDHSRFISTADFYKAQFGRFTSFEDVVFRASADFELAQFGYETKFNTARFRESVNFKSTRFSGNADFFGCHFLDHAEFNGADFGADAQFVKAQFVDTVFMPNAKLMGGVFDSTKFSKRVDFESTDLSRARFKNIDFKKTKVRWAGSILDDVEFSDVSYEYRNLRQNCRGIKGSATVWGDLLLRRDLQDQDYIDTLDERMKADRPKLHEWRKASGDGPEALTGKLRRIASNVVHWLWSVLSALRGDISPKVLIGMIACAFLAGGLVAAIVDRRFASWFLDPFSIAQSDGIDPLAVLAPLFTGVVLALLLASFVGSWFGKRAVFKLWGALGYGRDWDRVALFALFLIFIFGVIYQFRVDKDVAFAIDIPNCADASQDACSGGHHWFAPWFVAAMGFATLGISDVAVPLTGAGQLLLIANVLFGFMTFGLLLAVLGNRFARRS
ncbi:MAG: pentapeptide repeat-containing protein [Hyphomonadaceae bacterium]|nr:pentapeptide repeat-containing protein [Hyphomonadaceae bacterium]